MKKDRHCSS